MNERKKMLKEIGSNYWLDTSLYSCASCSQDVNLDKLGIPGKDKVFLSSGRASIRYAIRDIKEIKKKTNLTAIIPPFTCDTVVRPFLEEGVELYAYEISENLELYTEKLSEQIEKLHPDIIFIHRYYGFDTACDIRDTICHYKKEGYIFIEDQTQTLLSTFSTLDADYIVGSLRKWGALPDGGFCVKVNGTFNYNTEVKGEDESLIRNKLLAFGLKHSYMVNNTGRKEDFLTAFRTAEDILDNENAFYAMSAVSRQIWNDLDLTRIADKRRLNYSFIYDNLNNDKVSFITSKLNPFVVPLYFAIRSRNRAEIQSLLRENSIYAPIVWPRPASMPRVSDTTSEIYKEVLCLPVDQRYEIDDMSRMVEKINSFHG